MVSRQVINAHVPLANMFGYVNSLRSMSQGRAQYTHDVRSLRAGSAAVAEEVQAKYAVSMTDTLRQIEVRPEQATMKRREANGKEQV